MIDISGHLRPIRQECGFEDLQSFITVNCCGFQKFITKNYTRNREKGRLDYQIIYVIKGKGYFKIGQSLTEVLEGSIVIYRPHEEQNYQYYFQDNPEVYWVHFTGIGVDECLENAGLSGEKIINVGLTNNCIELFKRIMNELQVKRPLHEQFSNVLLLELLLQLGRRNLNISSGINKHQDKKFQKIIELMHSSYNLQWSVKDFAKECNLSIYRFIHNFKNHTGMSPMEYLTNVRIDKAKELLLDSSLNISEISNVLGYENPLYFSRVFKNKTGMPPSNFRRDI